MTTRRAFLGTAVAAAASLAAGTALADHTRQVVVTRSNNKRSRIELSYVYGGVASSLSQIAIKDNDRIEYDSNLSPTPDVISTEVLSLPEESSRVVYVTAPTRREMRHFINSVRDTVWTPAQRADNKISWAVTTYMDAYENMQRKVYHTRCNRWQLACCSTFMFTAVVDLPEKRACCDIDLCDCSDNRIMRKFKCTSKNGRTRTREVTRTHS